MTNPPTRLAKLLSAPFVGFAPWILMSVVEGPHRFEVAAALACALAILIGVLGLAVGMRPELLDLARMTVTRSNRPAQATCFTAVKPGASERSAARRAGTPLVCLTSRSCPLAYAAWRHGLTEEGVSCPDIFSPA